MPSTRKTMKRISKSVKLLLFLPAFLASMISVCRAQSRDSILDYYQDYIPEENGEQRLRIARDRLIFWADLNETVWGQAYKLRQVVIEKAWNQEDVRKELDDLYALDKCTYIYATLQCKHIFEHFGHEGRRFVFDYDNVLIAYYKELQESLKTNDEGRVVFWCKKNFRFPEGDDSPSMFSGLKAMGSPCAMLAYSKLANRNKEDIIGLTEEESAELANKAKSEMSYLLQCANSDIDYLEYVYQNLYIYGFCLSKDEYELYINKTEQIIQDKQSRLNTAASSAW